MILFLECITSIDCPDGGINFVCTANKCECQSPKMLNGDKCVGMLKFKKTKGSSKNYVDKRRWVGT